MRRARLFVTLFLASSVTLAQECPELVALRALYGVRHMLMEPYTDSYSIGQWIDRQLDELRDPLPSGGYRWVRFIRPAGDGPVVKREHLVMADQAGGDLDQFESEADQPFAFRIVVPRKRSLLKPNHEVYVGTLRVRYVKDGDEKTIEKRVNEWLAPGTSRSFDLGLIADRAEAVAEAAARRAYARESLLEIHFKQAVAQDDPENPNHDAVLALKRLRASPDPMTVDLEIGKLERRFFPGIDVIPFTTLTARIRDAEKLIQSEKEEDQIKGRKLLNEVVRSLPR